MQINILSPFVADLIAAGEVVERPASVVKELLENAIDAGARSITLELRGGGRTYIRVTDDGCGMAPEDAGVAFLRHATSKLKNPSDLEAIGTLGFRGEALAAISAVSRIELLTRQKGAAMGTRVTLEAGDIQEMGEHGCPEGTTMIIRDLFYNTPARLKFMKSDRSEAQSCIALALKCALGHPHVAVRCIRDGKEEFFSPGDGRKDSAVYTLLGRDTAQSFLACESADEAVRVTGFCSSPRAGRGNRSLQFFFCNGRAIKSLTLQAALEQAYKNTLLVGRFPACVLYIELSPAAVDVNVHPTKTEVKFSDERRVFDGVYHAVRSALEREETLAAPSVQRPEPRKPQPPKQETPEQTQIPLPVRKSAPTATVRTGASRPDPNFFRQMTAQEFRSGTLSEKTVLHTPVQTYQSRRDPIPTPRTVSAPAAAPSPAPAAKAPASPAPTPELPDFRLIGETMNTYILVELEDKLILIDKHAAHERVIFDKLRSQEGAVMSQTLLVPVTFSPGEEDTALLLENAELLDRFGFEVEAYGQNAVILRAVPADTDMADARPMLEELCEKLRLGRSTDPSELRDALLHTVACKAAIKAGKSSQPEELRRLAQKVLSGDVRYCPHGRPVSVTMTKKELDKLFKRIV